MKWANNFDFFLFDFDGLLVNTEKIHYQAYIELLKSFGFDLDWSFDEYCIIAHSGALQNVIYEKFPKLYQKHPSWDYLYKIKKDKYFDLLKKTQISLMPGVSELLKELDKNKILSCVVTNSVKEHVNYILKNSPELNLITHWITREDYKDPKPSSQCYFKAIELYGQNKKKIIGFEDSVKGINALYPTKVKCVLICDKKHPQLKNFNKKENIEIFQSLFEIPENFSI